MAIKSYVELEVWQIAMSLAEDVYGIVSAFPKDEQFALGSQLRRAVVSVPSNIAEGFGRETTKDFLHFIAMARGSLFEVRTQIELARRIGYIVDTVSVFDKVDRIAMMLNSLSAKLRRRIATNDPRTSNHEPPTTNHAPRTTNHEPRTTSHEPRATNHD